MLNKTCVIIAGPTAVGKTAAAIEMARHFSTAIISADSRQCFKEMTIGVAKPTPEELAQTPHYFINSHSIHEEVNAAVFEQYALQKAGGLFQQHDLVVVTGGTGLYLKAFCEGLDDMPPVSPAVRQAITTAYEQHGLGWLQQQVQEQDPLYYDNGETQNPQRLIRALEVKQATGKSIRTFQQGKKNTRNFNIIKLGLELPKPVLNDRIHTRVKDMIKQGLISEVEQLLPYKQLNALQTVGYSEVFDYLEGKLALETAVERIMINTRQYAKRQMTWFKKDTAIHWFPPNAIKEMIDTITRKVSIFT